MDERNRRLQERLANSREALFDFARTLDAESWTQPVFEHDGEAGWSAMDLLRHLAWAEGGMLRLMRLIRAGEDGVPEDFDLDRYNASGVRKLKDEMPAELLQRMEATRAEVLALMDDLKPEEWEKSGRHGSLQIMTIEEIVKTISLHEKMHLRDMQRVMQ